jgi:hypothetical protein
MLEQVGHRLDREVERLYRECEDEGLKGMEITHQIEEKIDLSNVLKTSTKDGMGDMWYAVSQEVEKHLRSGILGYTSGLLVYG